MSSPRPRSSRFVRTAALPVLGSVAVLVSALGAVLGAVLWAGCVEADTKVVRRTLFFAGSPVARIEERTAGSGAGRTVARVATLEDTGEVTTLTATLDAHGFATSARYTRGTLRTVALADLSAVAPHARVVLIDLLGQVQPASATEVALVDLSSAEVIAGRVERRGAEIVATDARGAVVARANVEGHRTGPGAFFEGDSAPATARLPIEIAAVDPRGVKGWRLVGVPDVVDALSADGPGQRRRGATVLHSAEPLLAPPPPGASRAEPFLESDDARVRAFAAPLASTGDALARVTRMIDAIHGRVDASKRALPPAAVVMLEQGGDCDGAAALLTAGLRAIGTPARPVVGYRWVDGRFVPHAWTEVYTPSGWLLADAAAPRIGDDPTYLKLFEGLGGALSMGRVLGRLQLEPITDAGAP